MLLSIGFIKDPFELQWNKNYELAKKYYEYHHNLLIPHIFKTTNGYEFDEDGVNLGFWISTQRKKIKDLSKQKLQMLKNIGFVEDVSEKEWQEKYMLAKQYYEHYKNLLIPGKFKTVNGFEYDENGILLGAWMARQRANFELLSQQKQQMLLKIGFVKDILESRWLEKYQLAKQYYEHFNNLLIPRTYRTVNGYEYDENGENLGGWLDNQKTRFEKLSKEKQQMLLNIEIFTNVKNNYSRTK